MATTLSWIIALWAVAWYVAPAFAQESADWSVFQETDPVECYAVSEPTSQENTRDGQPVEVARSETRLFVFYRPGEGVNGQVAFTGGYPFAPNSTVTLDVGGNQFRLFSQDEWAWPPNPEEDARIIEALQSSSEVVLIGQSGRGTTTRDTFSLQGFTASIEEAERSCQGNL